LLKYYNITLFVFGGPRSGAGQQSSAVSGDDAGSGTRGIRGGDHQPVRRFGDGARGARGRRLRGQLHADRGGRVPVERDAGRRTGWPPVPGDVHARQRPEQGDGPRARAGRRPGQPARRVHHRHEARRPGRPGRDRRGPVRGGHQLPGQRGRHVLGGLHARRGRPLRHQHHVRRPPDSRVAVQRAGRWPGGRRRAAAAQQRQGVRQRSAGQR